MTSVSLVSTASGVDTVTMPAHQAGDLLLFFAFRDGSNTPPTLPAGYTNIGSSGTNSHSHRQFYKIATSNAEAAPVATNATETLLIVLRGVNQTTPIGITPSGNTGTGTSVIYPDATAMPTDASGRNAVIYHSGHRSADTALETPPTGWTFAVGHVNAGEAAGFIRYGVRDTLPEITVAVGGTSSGWRAIITEILPDLSAVEEIRATATPTMIGITAGGPNSETRITTAPVLVGITVEATDAAMRVTAAPVLVGITVEAAPAPVSGRSPAINWN